MEAGNSRVRGIRQPVHSNREGENFKPYSWCHCGKASVLSVLPWEVGATVPACQGWDTEIECGWARNLPNTDCSWRRGSRGSRTRVEGRQAPRDQVRLCPTDSELGQLVCPLLGTWWPHGLILWPLGNRAATCQASEQALSFGPSPSAHMLLSSWGCIWLC